ncbi:helix-turn-helix domain-containing protein [Caldisalinibacter kiritimatiensis]|uniref:Helix-turn-helix motif:Cobalamin B12-binding protein n=1 Tax=Caldisalinibacter kiritimatiensis TaxID=1304284 RepID=R1AUC0_9FIRM|nr:helix-turn-helix transcriptional regulator [Caldisalinibacter kiritimatiensis]EOD00257.1 Helix-turn-helix motif:Cobalamin B12-binding protein [Caldisalinibacter kiritimatiensis]
MNFGARLKKLRKERNLRQEDLAKTFKISRQTISNYESSSRFPNDEEFLRKLASYFNVSLDYLLGASNIRLGYGNYNTKELKETKSNYSYKNQAIKKLFTEIDELSASTIEKIAEAIKLFKD